MQDDAKKVEQAELALRMDKEHVKELEDQYAKADNEYKNLITSEISALVILFSING